MRASLRSSGIFAAAALSMLMAGAPVQAQSGQIAITTDQRTGERFGDDLRGYLASTAVEFRGSGAVQAHLRIDVYRDGRLAASHASRAFQLQSGGSMASASLLPDQAWFDRYLTASGDRGIFSWLADLFGGGGSAPSPTDPWADFPTVASCATLSGEARRRCESAVRNRGRSESGEPGVIVRAVPVATDRNGNAISGVETMSMLFTPAGT